MPRHRLDLTNQTYGRLTVKERADARAWDRLSTSYWWCECACGNRVRVEQSALRRRRATLSCGCLQKEKATKILLESVDARRQRRTEIYDAAMMRMWP